MFRKKKPEPEPMSPLQNPAGRPPEHASQTQASASPESAPQTPQAAAPQPAPQSSAGAAQPIETGLLREQVIGQLRTVYDPEIPVNIYELGLVYKVDVDEERNVRIEMTLTSPACPSAEEIPVDVRRKTEAIEGVKSVDVRIVWDPPWSQEFMSEAARVQLGFF
jgi:FeS assembly SUF system protein